MGTCPVAVAGRGRELLSVGTLRSQLQLTVDQVNAASLTSFKRLIQFNTVVYMFICATLFLVLSHLFVLIKTSIVVLLFIFFVVAVLGMHLISSKLAIVHPVHLYKLSYGKSLHVTKCGRLQTCKYCLPNTPQSRFIEARNPPNMWNF